MSAAAFRFDWESAFGQAAACLGENDRILARDVVSLFIGHAKDTLYGITSPFAGEFVVEVFSSETSDTYYVQIDAIDQVSMKEVTKITNHESVYDIRFEINSKTKKMQAKIYIFKTKNSNHKEIRKYSPPEAYMLSTNAKMNGLIINRNSKETAKEIIEHVTNMEKQMWMPQWKNKQSDDGSEFMLMASPFQSFTLSFYMFLDKSMPQTINNIVLRAALYNDIPCISIMIYCDTMCAESDVDDADAGQWSDEPTKSGHGADRRKQAKGTSQLAVKRPISKHSKPSQSFNLMDIAKTWMGLK